MSRTAKDLFGATGVYHSNTVFESPSLNASYTPGITVINVDEDKAKSILNIPTSQMTGQLSAVDPADGDLLITHKSALEEDLKFYYLMMDENIKTMFDKTKLLNDDVLPLMFLELYQGNDAEAFGQAVLSLGKKMGVSPHWLMLVFFNESSLNPAVGKDGERKTAGLNQFTAETLANYSTDTLDDFAKRSGAEQIAVIEKMWGANTYNTFIDIPAYNFCPASLVKWPYNRIYLSSPNDSYENNKAFDLNNDGYVTVWDIRAYLLKKAYKDIPDKYTGYFYTEPAKLILSDQTKVTNSDSTVTTTTDIKTFVEDETLAPSTFLHKDDDINGPIVDSMHPAVAYKFARATNKAWSDSEKTRIVEGPRTREKQAQNVAAGVSWTSYSTHIYGLGGDVIDRVLAYVDNTNAIWDKIAKYYVAESLDNYVYRTSNKDRPHWQIANAASPLKKYEEAYNLKLFRDKPIWFKGDYELLDLTKIT